MNEIDELIQLMRTLTLAQIRKQLERDSETNIDRFIMVNNFFKVAKEQQR